MRGEYSTRQKREMLIFLRKHDLESYTVDDLVTGMGEQGESIGRTTAYRYLESLAEQGEVRKYQNLRGITLYQHVADHAACSEHLHLMCKKCGRLYHVDCTLVRQMFRHISQDHGFELDPRESVLVGICGSCAEKGKEEETHVTDNGTECNHRL